MSVPLSGIDAQVGGAYLKGVQAWLHEINTATGIYAGKQKGLLGRQVKLMYTDDQSQPANARTIYQKLIAQDKVDFLLPPFATGPAGTVAPLAEQYGYALIMTSATDSSLFQQGNPEIVQGAVPITNWGANVAPLIMSTPYRSVGMLTVNYPSSIPLQKALQSQFKADGIALKVNDLFEIGTTDWTSLLTKLKSANPDVIVAQIFGSDTTSFMKQAASFGLNPKMWVIIAGAIRNDVYIDGVGQSIADCTVGETQWSPDFPYPGVKELAAALGPKYLAASGVDGSASWGFAAGQLLTDAVDHLGTKSLSHPQTDIIKYLKSATGITTVDGSFKVNPSNGVNESPAFPLMQIQQGKRVIIWPKSLATGTLQTPCPAFGTANR
jgi:branched-chain amino acid transport system substrate-binding protein